MLMKKKWSEIEVRISRSNKSGARLVSGQERFYSGIRPLTVFVDI